MFNPYTPGRIAANLVFVVLGMAILAVLSAVETCHSPSAQRESTIEKGAAQDPSWTAPRGQSALDGVGEFPVTARIGF